MEIQKFNEIWDPVGPSRCSVSESTAALGEKLYHEKKLEKVIRVYVSANIVKELIWSILWGVGEKGDVWEYRGWRGVRCKINPALADRSGSF